MTKGEPDLELKKVNKEDVLKIKEEGNRQFKEGNFTLALDSYTEALRICPLSFPLDRSILYSNMAATKEKLDRKMEAIKDCSNAIELNNAYTKAIFRRAKLYLETEQIDDALKDYKRVLELQPNNSEARYAVGAFTELQSKMQETNQKLRIADVQVESLKKQIVHAQLTDKEIESLGENTRVYESVGRMFLLTDIPEVREGLKAKSEKCNEKITNLMGSKEILERSLNESQNNLREMIKFKQGAPAS